MQASKRKKMAAVAAVTTLASALAATGAVLGPTAANAGPQPGPRVVVLTQPAELSEITVSSSAPPAARLNDTSLRALSREADAVAAPLGELVEEYPGRASLAQATAWLESEHPDTFLHAKATESEATSYELVFTEKPSDDVIEKLEATLSIDVIASYGAPASSEEFTEASSDLISDVQRKLGNPALQAGENEAGTALTLEYNPRQVSGDC